MSSPPIVLRFSTWHFSAASDVMKLMNSETHSCTHSLASFEIFAVPGTDDFIIRDTFAICTRKGYRLTGGAENSESGTHWQEAVLFSIFPDFLLGNGRGRWCISHGLWGWADVALRGNVGVWVF